MMQKWKLKTEYQVSQLLKSINTIHSQRILIRLCSVYPKNATKRRYFGNVVNKQTKTGSKNSFYPESIMFSRVL